MLCEFLYLIPGRTRSGRLRADPRDPLRAAVNRMRSRRRRFSPLLRELRVDALALAHRFAVDDPSVPAPVAHLLGDRTLMVRVEIDEIADAFGDFIQLGIDADISVAELTSAEVYHYGDDSREVLMETRDFGTPWVSPASIHSLVHRVNPGNRERRVPGRDSRFAETGYADDYLLLTRRARPDQFIQTFLDPRTGVWRVEASDDGTWFTTCIDDGWEVAEILRRWLPDATAVVDARWRREDHPAALPLRDMLGRFVPAPEDDGDDDGDDGPDDTPTPTPAPAAFSALTVCDRAQ